MVGAAVDVCIDRFVVMARGQQHRHGLLGGRGIVQINQWPTVDRVIEDREFGNQRVEMDHK